MKYVMYDIVTVEERKSRLWLRGAGENAAFTNKSDGWFAVLNSSPSSMYLGMERPELKDGDLVKITVERANEIS